MKIHAPARSRKSADAAGPTRLGFAPPQPAMLNSSAAPLGALHDYARMTLRSGASDVSVHAGTPPPARQLRDEAQSRDRVKPALQIKGIAINDDARPRNEADRNRAAFDAPGPPATRPQAPLPPNPLSAQYTRQPKTKHVIGDNRRAPIQAKIAYPIKVKTLTVADSKALKPLLSTEFGSSTSPEMIGRYINEIEEQPTIYSKIDDIRHQIDTRVGYNILGGEKWREFIDAKDHQAALDAVERKEIAHPGNYYDYKQKMKVGKHFEAFMDADSFVSQRLNTKLSAAEYFHINVLASQGITSNALKGPRTGEVTWGLPKADEKQRANLAEQGLTNLEDDKAGGVKVHVAMPKEGVQKAVQQKLNEYYSIVDSSQDSLTRLSAIISLYQSLEALHAFKDATSRTNHLVLNKLLAENGLEPAILNEPNSPTSSHDEFGRHLVEGIGHTRKIAATAAKGGGRNRHATLAAERDDHESAIRMSERLKKQGMDPEERDPNVPPPRPKEIGASVAPFYARIDHLMGGDEPVNAATSSNKLEVKDAKSGPQHAPTALKTPVIPAADMDKKADEKSSSPPKTLSAKLEKRGRLLLGHARIDQLIAYRNKKAASGGPAS